MNTRLRCEIQSRHEAAWVARQTLNMSWKHFSRSPSNHFHFWSFVVKKENRIWLVIFGAVNGEYGTQIFLRETVWLKSPLLFLQYSLLTEIKLFCLQRHQTNSRRRLEWEERWRKRSSAKLLSWVSARSAKVLWQSSLSRCRLSVGKFGRKLIFIPKGQFVDSYDPTIEETFNKNIKIRNQVIFARI